MKESYNNGITDEFIVPFVVTDEHGQAQWADPRRGCVHHVQLPRRPRAADHPRAGAQQRPDAEKQAASCLVARIWTRRSRAARFRSKLHYVCMTQYDKHFTLPMVILPESMENLLADMLAQANLRNLRVAETEKYAHVTYFFNGGIEKPFPGEDRDPDSVAEGGDLRSRAGDVRGGDRGHGGEGRERPGVRRGGGELRECGYGGPLGQAGADDQSGRDRRRVPGSDLSGDETAGRRRLAHHRGSRQRRADGRPCDGRTAHSAHDESRAVHLCE